jgi:hypothetical protein
VTAPDRAPDGALLVGQGAPGGVYHAAVAGSAACSPTLPILAPVPIGQATDARWCHRGTCRPWLTERRAQVAGDVEYICPACYVERAAQVRPCPSCGSTYAATPEAMLR